MINFLNHYFKSPKEHEFSSVDIMINGILILNS